ncbi:MAG: exodeoxyribonuclease VII large subunit [Pseudomonadota bacterium]
MPAAKPDVNDIYSISRLNREVRNVLEEVFPTVWVQGEISNLAKPASGHLYFSLKDKNAQVRCAMFRNRQSGLRFQPESGMEVLARANISLYEGRGEFQLIIESLQPAGDGALQLAFEQLKQKLAKEGLFDEDAKQPLPGYPESIGIITSPTGAAVRDILSVLKRRYPISKIIIYPVPVQGEDAAAKITSAIQSAEHRKECDVLILARGGGSIEDLWSFNEEILARAIAECSLPIVSGVGHEIDFTIADFVADQRAPTPSVAAEMVSPDSNKLLQQIENNSNRLVRFQQDYIRQWQQNLDYLAKQLIHPQRHLDVLKQQANQYLLKLHFLIEKNLNDKKHNLTSCKQSLREQNPGMQIQQLQQNLKLLGKNIHQSMRFNLKQFNHAFNLLQNKLNAYSPDATLSRGYAYVTNKQTGTIIHDGKQLKQGDVIAVTLAKSGVDATVDDIHEK